MKTVVAIGSATTAGIVVGASEIGRAKVGEVYCVAATSEPELHTMIASAPITLRAATNRLN